MIKVIRLFGMCKCIDLSEEERTTCPHCTEELQLQKSMSHHVTLEIPSRTFIGLNWNYAGSSSSCEA